MRTLFLALMITLLPLRGWVGDVMAVELSRQSTAAHHAAPVSAPSVHHEAHAAGAPHHGHTMADAAAPCADADEEQGLADCTGCTVCQICHSVALTPVLPELPPAVRPTSVPASSQPLYASAERALGDKPPIS